MKILPLVTSFALTCISITVHASSPSNIAVYSTEQSTGSISIGNSANSIKTLYSFNIHSIFMKQYYSFSFQFNATI